MSHDRRARLWPEGPLGVLALAALACLWAAFFLDLGVWVGRLTGKFSSKANFASHFSLYIAAAGVLVGLLARGVPNFLRSLPTVWLLISLAILYGRQFLPRATLPPPLGPVIKVMTVNLGGSLEGHAAVISYMRAQRHIDVFFLQEVHGTKDYGDRQRIQDALGDRLPHSAWYIPPRDTKFGLGIVSRFPLREIRSVDLPAPPGGACSPAAVLTAKARVRQSTVRLATTHLCPPRMPWESRRVGIRRRDVRRELSWMEVVRRYGHARRAQLIYLRVMAEGGLDPFILAGTLNTTPASLDIRRLSRGLRDAYSERGYGFGFTRYVGFFGARTDHIFATPNVRARSAQVKEVEATDHRPVEAALEIPPDEGR